jgi:peptide-methionine (R)-S-oxide reductase
MRSTKDLPDATVTKSEDEWRAQLSPAEYDVLRTAGTELFRSTEKFDSHCGWPSFFSPLAGERVIERTDRSWGMPRTEVLCAACHSHLGHVFEGEGYDTPTDLRYCINSISMTFEESQPTS